MPLSKPVDKTTKESHGWKEWKAVWSTSYSWLTSTREDETDLWYRSLLEKRKKSSSLTQSACPSFSYQETAVISTHHIIFMATMASCGKALQSCYLPCGGDQVLSQCVSVPPCDLLLCPWSFVYCLHRGELKPWLTVYDVPGLVYTKINVTWHIPFPEKLPKKTLPKESGVHFYKLLLDLSPDNQRPMLIPLAIFLYTSSNVWVHQSLGLLSLDYICNFSATFPTVESSVWSFSSHCKMYPSCLCQS